MPRSKFERHQMWERRARARQLFLCAQDPIYRERCAAADLERSQHKKAHDYAKPARSLFYKTRDGALDYARDKAREVEKERDRQLSKGFYYRERKRLALLAHEESVREKKRLAVAQRPNPLRPPSYYARLAAFRGRAPITKFAIAKLHGWLCWWCASLLDFDTITKDHVVPLSKGGTHTLDNVVPSCKSCNSSKNATSDVNKWLRRTAATRTARLRASRKGRFS